MNRLPIRFRLCPPHFKLQSLRVDSPTCKLDFAYENDLKFFKNHPKRNSFIRWAYMNEFDLDMANAGEWAQIPRLHVLVTKLAVGTHLVAPVYRGKAFFADVTTDNEVAMIVADMSKLNGIDIDEFEAYEAKYNAQNAAPMAFDSEIVH